MQGHMPKFLYAALKLCNNCDLNYRAARNKRLLVEITLIETAQLSLPENADDASGGRSPIRRLLPIFAPAPAQAAGAQRIANARKSPHEAAAQQPTAGNSPAAPAQPLTAQQAQPATTAPTIRRSSGMSRLNTVALHRTTATAATERQAAAGSPMPTTDNPATAALLRRHRQDHAVRAVNTALQAARFWYLPGQLRLFQGKALHPVSVPRQHGAEQDGPSVSADHGKFHPHHLRKP